MIFTKKKLLTSLIIRKRHNTAAETGGNTGQKGYTMKKFRGFPVYREQAGVMMIYSQFDMGAKYKIYTSCGDSWQLSISFQTIGEANKYFDRLVKSREAARA